MFDKGICRVAIGCAETKGLHCALWDVHVAQGRDESRSYILVDSAFHHRLMKPVMMQYSPYRRALCPPIPDCHAARATTGGRPYIVAVVFFGEYRVVTGEIRR